MVRLVAPKPSYPVPWLGAGGSTDLSPPQVPLLWPLVTLPLEKCPPCSSLPSPPGHPATTQRYTLPPICPDRAVRKVSL